MEAVADTEHQAVALLQQLVDAILDGGVAQERGDKLTRAVRLVAAGEAARKNDHLRAADSLLKLLGGLVQRIRREVAHHNDLGRAARVFNRARGVIFAVRAGEHRNNGKGLGGFDCRGLAAALGPGYLGQMLVRRVRAGREHALQAALERRGQLVQRHAFARDCDRAVVRRAADQPVSG